MKQDPKQQALEERSEWVRKTVDTLEAMVLSPLLSTV